MSMEKSIPKLDAAPPSMGTFPGDLPQNELEPKYSQDELKKNGGNHQRLCSM